MAGFFIAHKNLRQLAGWSFAQLSARTGSEHPITRSYLNRLEHGRNKPSNTTLWRIAQALATSSKLQSVYTEDTETVIYSQLVSGVGGIRLNNGSTLELSGLDQKHHGEAAQYLMSSLIRRGNHPHNAFNLKPVPEPASIAEHPLAVLDGVPLNNTEQYEISKAIDRIRLSRKSQKNGN